MKSNADDIEYDRWYRPAGFALSRGSSFSRDSFREEATPEREEDSDGKSSPSESSAKDASSRESRPGTCRGRCISV